jgi:very-short-patch-repair endonuclease
MFRLHQRLAQFLRSHHGVVSQPDLERLAVPRRHIRRLVRARILERVGPAAWRLTATPRTLEHRVAVACAVHPRAVAAFTTAGHLWGLHKMGNPTIHIIIPGDAHPEPRYGTRHHCYHVDDEDVIERGDGIRVTTPTRTVFDLAAVLSDPQLESVIEQLLDRRLTTIAALAATGVRLRQRGRTGSARFGRVLESRPATREPVGSNLELRFERAIINRGLPRPLRQQPFAVPNGQRIRVDFYWPAQRIVVEVDHHTWHDGRTAANTDKRRDRLLAALGLRSLRVTDDDINHRLDIVIDEIAHVLHHAA